MLKFLRRSQNFEKSPEFFDVTLYLVSSKRVLASDFCGLLWIDEFFGFFFLSKNWFYFLSRSAASPSMLRKFSSPIVANEGTPTTANKNYVKLITKRVSKVTTQLEAATGISRRSLGNPWLNVSNYNVTQIFED